MSNEKDATVSFRKGRVTIVISASGLLAVAVFLGLIHPIDQAPNPSQPVTPTVAGPTPSTASSVIASDETLTSPQATQEGSNVSSASEVDMDQYHDRRIVFVGGLRNRDY